MSNEEGAKSKWLKINLKVSLYQIETDKLENWAKLIIGKNWKRKKTFFGHFDLEAESKYREGKGQFGLCKGLSGLLVKGPFMVIWSHQPLGN